MYDMPKITAIITNYNGRLILEKCLPETHAILMAHGIHEIILADDCSTDDSLDYVSKNFPDIIHSTRSKNGGFSANCNSGAKKATGDIFFFLNNDMVPKKLNITSIHQLFNENPQLFSLSPKIERHQDGKLIDESPSYGYFKGGWFHTISGKKAPNTPTLAKLFPILWGCGGALFVNKTKFNELNGFSETFFVAYCEDLDLCYRAWRLGFENYYTADTSCFHHHQSTLSKHFTSNTITNISLTNRYIFTWRNLTNRSYIVHHLFGVFIRILFFQFDHIKAILKALTRLSQIFLFRRKFKSKRSDKEILDLFAIKS